MIPVAILFTTLIIAFSPPATSFTAEDAYPFPHIIEPMPSYEDLSPVRREVYDEGRIIDITHRYRPEMPTWESEEGLGQFLWLPASMKNGSLANNSEFKLPSHTGTHVDAPGHVFDHYFDAGFDVDTLDLHVLNGELSLWFMLFSNLSSSENMMARKMSPLLIFLMLVFYLLWCCHHKIVHTHLHMVLIRILVVVLMNPQLMLFLMLVLPSMVLSSQDGADKLIPPRREVYGNGKIFDITHTITIKNPSGLRNEAFYPYLQLFMSMKNGSDYNFSLIKLPAHSGTHVDAPGHFYENYYEAGFDIDSLDLEVLNANMMARKMSPRSIFFIFLLPTMVLSSQDSSNSAYPPPYGVEKEDSCDGELIPPRREVHGNGRIYDITHRITSETRQWDSDEGLGSSYLTLHASMKNGSDCNFSQIKLPVHSGTHVDAPGHVFDNYFEAGFDIDSLDLEVLNGPALLVDVPRDKNLTAEVMKSLNIPRGVKRVLFRTLNTDRRLMWKKQFDTSYVGFMKDGAQWLKDNTDIKLVGTDYLSVAAFDDLIPAHLVFLESREIILVEGLKLEDVKAGLYDVHCLPLRLLGAEGSPIRCILMS
ncbi:hypothetical protein OSB04_030710 [Centaurea solstitialis]|uniref:Cyclase n=1 Tax=Centaurea solstitialis TaxID=347529 RepID=A0AA38VWY9_9ASTR|nr:hypothetical protein OSB04_030710 [Centaurea solstitialis]